MNSHRDVLEVIDAFVDGEHVDTGVLKTALADPDGRDYVVDAWLLREAVQQDRDLPVVARPQPRAPWLQRAAGRWSVAAALAIGLAGGYVAGNQWPRTAPPVQVAEAPSAAVPPPSRAVFPAPQPTRVIQLEFQPDATRSGGN